MLALDRDCELTANERGSVGEADELALLLILENAHGERAATLLLLLAAKLAPKYALSLADFLVQPRRAQQRIRVHIHTRSRMIEMLDVDREHVARRRQHDQSGERTYFEHWILLRT